MKKISIMIMVITTCLNITGCGVATEIAKDAQKQLEWAEENNTLTDCKSVSKETKEIVDAITDAVINENEESTESEYNEISYLIGDTVPLVSTSDSGTTHLDFTITGYFPVFNGVKNVTAIFYTVTSKDGPELMFDNTQFNVYADNCYVGPEIWNEWSNFSYGVLLPGTSYEGCYVADVDATKVNEIVLCCAGNEWIIQEETIPNQTSVNNRSEDASKWAGLYTDGISNASISIYSSPDDSSVGCYSFTLDGYGEISGELKFCPNDDIFLPVDSSVLMTIWCYDNDGVKSIEILITEGLSDTFSYQNLIMTEHYES